MERLLQVGDTTVLGASGDISDFQYIKHTLQDLTYVETHILEKEGEIGALPLVGLSEV